MSTIITTQTIFVFMEDATVTGCPSTMVTVCWKVADRGAPKIVDAFACLATVGVNGPIGGLVPAAMPARLLSTRKSAKKIGDCNRIGRQDENGLVPVRLYRPHVSWVIAWRDSGSVLPLYFFWIFCISGWMSCIRREA